MLRGVFGTQMPLVFYDFRGFGIAWDCEFEEKMKIKTTWTKLFDLDFYTEGPALDVDGNLYFSTLTGQAIMKLDVDGGVTEWARIQCPNGHRITQYNLHWVCDTQDRAIVELDARGRILGFKVRETCAGFPFESPNDLALDQQGGLYFTDSVRHKGQIFYIGPEGEEKRVASDLDYPNGIVLSPDGHRLYVAESINNRILVADLADNGVLASPPCVFVELPRNPLPLDRERMPHTANLPDGLAIDPEGRLWVAHYGMGVLQVVDAHGKLIDSIPTGIPATSNLCFTPDQKSIYVTGGTGEPGPGCVHKIILL